MIRYTYELKDVVERTPKYNRVLKMMKDCMKDGGRVEMIQTKTILKENVKKAFRSRSWVKVKRHLAVFDIKMELERK